MRSTKRKIISILPLFLSILACQNESAKKGKSSNQQQSGEQVQRILTSEDLRRPNFKALSLDELEEKLKSEDELFEYEAQADQSASKDKIPDCFIGLYKRNPVEGKNGRYRLRLSYDQQFVDCWSSTLEAIHDSLNNTSGTATEINEQYCTTIDYSITDAQLPRLGSESLSDIYAEFDFSPYNGRSLLDIANDNKTIQISGRQKSTLQSKMLDEQSACVDKSFAHFELSEIEDENCTAIVENGTKKESCTKTIITRIDRVTQGGLDAKRLNEEWDIEHFVYEESTDLTRTEKAEFPSSGIKKVTYRNWIGEIQFNAGNPTFKFTNQLNPSEEVLTGTFQPSAD